MQSAVEIKIWLTKLYAAREAILFGKSYSINGRGITRADEHWISSEISKAENKLSHREGCSGFDVVFNRGSR